MSWSILQTHVKQKNDVMAAMYSLEIAHKLKVCTDCKPTAVVASTQEYTILNSCSILKGIMKQSLSSREQSSFRHR